MRLLEDAVSRDRVAGGLVQDHQVDVVRAQALERLVDGGGAFEERRPELRLEENLLARFRGCAHAATDGALVHVDVRRVDQRVAVVERVGDRRLRVVRLEQVGAEADLGDGDAVVQGDVVHVNSFVVASCVRWLDSVALNRADAADCQRIPIPGWFVWGGCIWTCDVRLVLW